MSIKELWQNAAIRWLSYLLMITLFAKCVG